MKDEIMLRHNISKPTVYREMKKETPGLYKIPNYNPPMRKITEQEIKLVKELLLRPVPPGSTSRVVDRHGQVMQIPRIVEAETGIRCNWDRVDRIREIIDDRIRSHGPEGYETEFHGEAKNILAELLNHEKMGMNSYITIESGGRTFKVSREAVNDIRLRIERDNPPEGENNFKGKLREFAVLRDKFSLTLKLLIESAHRGDFTPSANAMKEMHRLLKQIENDEVTPVLKMLANVRDRVFDGILKKSEEF